MAITLFPATADLRLACATDLKAQDTKHGTAEHCCGGGASIFAQERAGTSSVKDPCAVELDAADKGHLVVMTKMRGDRWLAA